MPPTTGRNGTLVAGLCCTAPAAVVLTGLVVWLINERRYPPWHALSVA